MELMPLGLDQKSMPSSGARSAGGGSPARSAAASRCRRQAVAQDSDAGPQIDDDYLYKVVDALDDVAKERARPSADRLDWLLHARRGKHHHRRPQRGAAARQPRRGRLVASAEQMKKLDAASDGGCLSYWHQRGFAERNPPPV